MGTLHNVTQIRPFILSEDGAFLPISPDCESELLSKLNENASASHLDRVPVEIQQARDGLSIHGMNTIPREFSVTEQGSYLYLRAGERWGYGPELSKFLELVSKLLDDFHFFILWNGKYVDEYQQSNSQLELNLSQNLTTNDYDDFFVDRFKSEPVVLHSYLLDTGLWAKRSYEHNVAEHGADEQEIRLMVEDFPDAIKILNHALVMMPGDHNTLNAIKWYTDQIATHDG